ncbi:MAG: hypothetical protein ACPGED_02170, partial [Flavobacteriales bacterium]
FEGTPISGDGKQRSPEALLNQTSLIDAIQEAEVSQPQLLDMFSFEMDGEPTSVEQEAEPSSTIEPKEDLVVEEEKPEQEPKQEEVAQPEQEVEPEVSKETQVDEVDELQVVEKETKKEKKVIAKAKKEEAGSLAEKLEKSPIDNLKSAIGLNRKFQFINTLFEGDNEKYDASIKLLNQDQTLKEARDWVSSNVPQSFEDEDDAMVLEAFIDLVERRHS